MIKTLIAAAVFTFACNFANATQDNSPQGTVTVGAPVVVASL